ncbi:hypothetical protein ACN38_g11959 [Penicillium nordicum]|uniref:Uncharacterized protein n=1 Tax=Penicillium nordicum TaxID=229535 RepID=A0A0M9WAM2_9EURO|nr:hypothetical protein ACN38_g11959 [Penicillium nordicum]
MRHTLGSARAVGSGKGAESDCVHRGILVISLAINYLYWRVLSLINPYQWAVEDKYIYDQYSGIDILGALPSIVPRYTRNDLLPTFLGNSDLSYSITFMTLSINIHPQELVSEGISIIRCKPSTEDLTTYSLDTSGRRYDEAKGSRFKAGV